MALLDDGECATTVSESSPLLAATGPDLSLCQQCGREVPTANLVLHEMRCNGAAVSRERREQPQARRQQQEQEPHLEREQEQGEKVEGGTTPAVRPTGLDRGQQTLDRWLTSGSLSGDGGRRARNGAERSSSNSASGGSANSNSRAPAAARAASASNGNGSSPAAAARAASASNNNDSSPAGTSAQAPAGGSGRGGDAQWRCSRCNHMNRPYNSNCTACFEMRPGAQATEQSGWVERTYNPNFTRGPNGIGRAADPDPPMFNIRLPQNPLIHSSTFVGTIARILNGLLNGVIIGFVLANFEGGVVGGLAGAACGLYVDRTRGRQEEDEHRSSRDIADMLARDDGGIRAGTVRVHRGRGHITALANDGRRGHRVIRVRYGAGRDADARRERRERIRRADASEARRRLEGAREDLERSLLEILVRMSYSREFGPGTGENVILRPEESFEELITRFGLEVGTGGGASQAVIESYPVEVIRKAEVDDDEEEESDFSEDDCYSGSEDGSDSEGGSEGESERDFGGESDNDDGGSSQGTNETDETGEWGTCNICLEDYREGEHRKTLGCRHGFHRECIDRWLKQAASCPVCKGGVGMYKAPPGTGVVGGR